MGSFLAAAVTSHAMLEESRANTTDVNVDLADTLSLAIFDRNPNETGAQVIDQIALEVTPNSNGVFVSGAAHVLAATNNETGYTLTMSDVDNDTALVHSAAATNTIPSITAASGDLTDITVNQWGWAFGDNTTTLGSVYNPVPPLATPAELDRTTAPGSVSYPFMVATKIDGNVMAGTYSDELVFSLVANRVPVTEVVLDKNEASYNPKTLVTGTIVDDEGNTVTGMNLGYNKKITLPANAYERVGYRFLGWDADASAITPTYTDQDTVEWVTAGPVDTLTLYAIWQPKNFPTSLTQMQSMTADICTNVYMPTGNTSTGITTSEENFYFSSDSVPETILTDVRDNKTYVVRKLADGKCWMAQNLAIGGTSAVTINYTTSDMTSGSFTIPASQSSDWCDPNNRSGTAGCANRGRMRAYPGEWMNGTTQMSSGTPPSQSQYTGNFYNWYVATVGTGLWATLTETTVSICPKNWRLPTGGKNSGDAGNDIYDLRTAYNNNTSMISAAGAMIMSGKLYSQGSNRTNNTMELTTSTPTTNLYRQTMFGQSWLQDQKESGVPIRCVAR